MTKLTAMTVAMVLATLVMSGVVHAQDLIANGGVLQAADCQANTLTLKAADGLPRAFATTSRTLLYVNSATADLCTLPLYVGSDVTVWLNAPSDRRIVGRVDVLTAPAPPCGAACARLHVRALRLRAVLRAELRPLLLPQL